LMVALHQTDLPHGSGVAVGNDLQEVGVAHRLRGLAEDRPVHAVAGGEQTQVPRVMQEQQPRPRPPGQQLGALLPQRSHRPSSRSRAWIVAQRAP